MSRSHVEQPRDLDIAAARRASEQTSAEERAAAVRKVQAMLDAGQVRLTVRNGKVLLSLLRPLDAKDPYTGKLAPAPKPTAPAPKPADPMQDMFQWR